MKRSQRATHAAIWPTLVAGMLLALALAYIAREQTTQASKAAPVEVAR